MSPRLSFPLLIRVGMAALRASHQQSLTLLWLVPCVVLLRDAGHPRPAEPGMQCSRREIVLPPVFLLAQDSLSTPAPRPQMPRLAELLDRSVFLMHI